MPRTSISSFSFSSLLLPSAFILLTFLASPVRAGFVETFDNGSNVGDWHLTVNPATIEPDGGNPGPYLHAMADAAVPTWYVPYLTPTIFLGNYAAKRVGTLAVDLDIFSGVQVPDRAITLDLNTTLGTGDFSKGSTPITSAPTSRNSRSAGTPVSSRSSLLAHHPARLGRNQRQRPARHRYRLAGAMQDVETLGVELGEPGFAIPSASGTSASTTPASPGCFVRRKGPAGRGR